MQDTPPASTQTSTRPEDLTPAAAPDAAPPAAAEASERGRWSSPAEFTIACIGYAVGLGNFWRFPYLAFQYGGGAFLVPYTCVLFIIGVPLFLLELGVGQKYQTASSLLWPQVHPALGGLGVASTLATLFVALYYNVIVAWALWFLFNSFRSPLPWAEELGGAQYYWEVQTLQCREESEAEASGSGVMAASACDVSGSADGSNATALAALGHAAFNGSVPTCTWDEHTSWPASPGLSQTGGVVWPLAGCLAFGWVLIWLCVWKGIASVGKVAWFTALFPYAVLFILLIRGVTLPGAELGLAYYLEPDFSKLGDGRVWVAAASQIFYSTGIGWGTLIAFASYNDEKHNFVRDSWLVPLINCGTSFLAGIVVFSVLGYMAKESCVSVAELTLEGSGLAFVVYPEAISKMPGAPIFAVLFFVMLLCLGMDSQFAMVETLMTAINDAKLLPCLGKEKKSALVCAMMCLFGLLFVTRGGIHWLELFDSFAANFTLFTVGCLECIAVGWVYGVDRFAADAQKMCGAKLPRLLLWDIKYVIPLLLIGLTISSVTSSLEAAYAFPPWGIGAGWLLALASSLPIPFFAARAFLAARARTSDRRKHGVRMPSEATLAVELPASSRPPKGLPKEFSPPLASPAAAPANEEAV